VIAGDRSIDLLLAMWELSIPGNCPGRNKELPAICGLFMEIVMKTDKPLHCHAGVHK